MSIFRAKKTLGQHFLKSEGILEKIVGAGRVTTKDTVLEIGPGEGSLTQKLLEKAGKVIVVEKDDRLIPVLQEKFKNEISAGKLELIHCDVLTYQPRFSFTKSRILDSDKSESGLTNLPTYKLIANLPYYITGKLLRKFLTADQKPSLAVLMLQKEVAERIVARNGKESILSLSVKIYGEPKLVASVGKRYFRPEPNVDSAILLIDQISSKLVKEKEEIFFRLIKAGFSSKRKKLFSNILPLISDKKTLVEAFSRCQIGENERAEDLSPEAWTCLSRELDSKILN